MEDKITKEQLLQKRKELDAQIEALDKKKSTITIEVDEYKKILETAQALKRQNLAFQEKERKALEEEKKKKANAIDFSEIIKNLTASNNNLEITDSDKKAAQEILSKLGIDE